MKTSFIILRFPKTREILKHLLVGSYPKKSIIYETPIRYPNSQISKTQFTKFIKTIMIKLQ